MEVIVDELQKNGIRIDMTLLNTHVNRILCIYKTVRRGDKSFESRSIG